jgi:predicted secreted hydrolase
MNVRMGDWSLTKEADGAYAVAFPARGFTLALRLEATQPPMLNGDRGYSQKTSDPAVASHYYSVPQLAVTGTVTRDGRVLPVTGTAWLDREWFTVDRPAPLGLDRHQPSRRRGAHGEPGARP